MYTHVYIYSEQEDKRLSAQLEQQDKRLRAHLEQRVEGLSAGIWYDMI